jgi:hypothetical protein
MPTKPVIQYAHDGKPIRNPSVNSLSGVAYFYTKGIDGQPRIPTSRLIEILADLGVTDPKGSSFSVTLPNGVVLSSTAGALAEPSRQLKASKPKGVVNKIDRLAALRNEGEAVKAWKANGGAGPRPETPATDAKCAELQAKAASTATKTDVTPITKASQTRRPSRAAATA